MLLSYNIFETKHESISHFVNLDTTTLINEILKRKKISLNPFNANVPIIWKLVNWFSI